MPVYNFSVPATSPIIKFAGNYWTRQESAMAWLNGGVSSTSVNLAFNGTGVYVSGPRMDMTDCAFSMDIDGTVYNQDLPRSGLAEQDNEIIFTRNDLSSGLHNLTMYNFSASCMDIGVGFINITTGDGDSTTSFTSTRLDQTNINNVSLLGDWESGTAGSSTVTYRGSANVSFFGNAIAVYGGAGSSYGPYNVSLDGGPPTQWNASASNATSDALLFAAHNLSTGSHSVSLVNNDGPKPSYLGFHYALVTAYQQKNLSSGGGHSSTASSISPSSSSPAVAPTLTPNPHHTPPAGAIAGGVVGGFLLLAILTTTVYICTLRRRYRRVGSDAGDPRSDAPAATEAPNDSPPRAEPQMEEVDMPPPNYRQVFPSDRAPSAGDIPDRLEPLRREPPADVPLDAAPMSGRRNKRGLLRL